MGTGPRFTAAAPRQSPASALRHSIRRSSCLRSASICSISPRTRAISRSTSRTSLTSPVRRRSTSVSRFSITRELDSRASRSATVAVVFGVLRLLSDATELAGSASAASNRELGIRNVPLIERGCPGLLEAVRAPANPPMFWRIRSTAGRMRSKFPATRRSGACAHAMRGRSAVSARLSPGRLSANPHGGGIGIPAGEALSSSEPILGASTIVSGISVNQRPRPALASVATAVSPRSLRRRPRRQAAAVWCPRSRRGSAMAPAVRRRSAVEMGAGRAKAAGPQPAIRSSAAEP